MKKLVDAGVHTVEGLARASRRQLSTVKGLSEQKVEKLKQIGASSSEARVRGVMRVDGRGGRDRETRRRWDGRTDARGGDGRRVSTMESEHPLRKGARARGTVRGVRRRRVRG